MIGIDAVDVDRLRKVLERSEGTENRLFTLAERTYCRGKGDPTIHFAGTLAVKEAVIKAGRLGSLAAWGRRIEVRRDSSGAPSVTVQGLTQPSFEISISHDGPVAVAVAVARTPDSPSARRMEGRVRLTPRPNDQLTGYLTRSLEGPPQAGSVLGMLHAFSDGWAGTDFP